MERAQRALGKLAGAAIAMSIERAASESAEQLEQANAQVGSLRGRVSEPERGLEA